ncbi:DNA topoisomerase 2 [Tanacetum coccineum]
MVEQETLSGDSDLKMKMKETGVSHLSGDVSEKTRYHHGVVSLEDAMVGMAASDVGTNNINLLIPQGLIDDDILLNYLKDTGVSIEPEWFIPTIPMVLANGSDGTRRVLGWSSFDIIANLDMDEHASVQCKRRKMGLVKKFPSEFLHESHLCVIHLLHSTDLEKLGNAAKKHGARAMRIKIMRSN